MRASSSLRTISRDVFLDSGEIWYRSHVTSPRKRHSPLSRDVFGMSRESEKERPRRTGGRKGKRTRGGPI